MCCENSGAKPEDGEEDVCDVCGGTTYGGYSDETCGYSPVLCEKCGYAPCDDSC